MIKFKYILVGNAGVGKTSLCEKYCKDAFNSDMRSTIGVEFFVDKLKINGEEVIIQLWDTAGHERFRSITSGYYRGAHCVIFVFDITNRQSFEDLETWLYQALQKVDPNAVFILVGSKKDRIEERKVSQEEIDEFAKNNEILYIETSAKTGECIKDIFHDAAHTLYEKAIQMPEYETIQLTDHISSNKCGNC